ncbi:hypothetical protein NWF32_15670 [Pseudomonas qingdaonensis]|nr:hypothetical protein [Pseudomonas qingdaonensis]
MLDLVIQRRIEIRALLQVLLGVARGGGFFSRISTWAPAGSTTEAEMAEAAITEKD